MKVRILLLQARDDGDPVRAEERVSFARKSGLGVEQIETHDLLTGPPSRSVLDRVDGLMVGGSGDYYVSNSSLPHMDASLEFLRQVADRGFPMFASCFGFQLMVEALGGEIAYRPETTEVGTFDLRLTAAGQRDELLGILPEIFPAQLGHKDRAESLPPGVIHLASSELNRYQAFRLPGLPIWATQFHPELDRRTNRQRFERYLDGYTAVMTDDERRRTADRFYESRETADLLPRFLHLVFGE